MNQANGPLSHRERLIATGEVLLGATVVIGHNVFHAIPNEVPILDGILILSLLMRRRPPRSIGLGRPRSWNLTVLVAVCGGVLLQLKDFVTEPLAHFFWDQQERVSSVISSVHHSPLMKFKSLAIVWIFAAFGEELAYRALLLRRSADALNNSHLAVAVAMIISSVLLALDNSTRADRCLRQHHFRADPGRCLPHRSAQPLGSCSSARHQRYDRCPFHLLRRLALHVERLKASAHIV